MPEIFAENINGINCALYTCVVIRNNAAVSNKIDRLRLKDLYLVISKYILKAIRIFMFKFLLIKIQPWDIQSLAIVICLNGYHL